MQRERRCETFEKRKNEREKEREKEYEREKEREKGREKGRERENERILTENYVTTDGDCAFAN